MEPLNLAVIVKLEPDFSEGNVSYKPDGTLNRNETKSTLGPHSGIAAKAAFMPRSGTVQRFLFVQWAHHGRT